jgi:hypothetical protein
MPFFDETKPIGDLSAIAPDDAPPPDPSLLDVFGAAFRTQNTIGSLIASSGQPNPYEIEDDFDAIDYVKDDPKFAPYVDEFSGIFNRKAADAKKIQIQREEQDRRTVEAGGVSGIVGSMAAGFFDLPTLLPIGGPLVGGARGIGQLALRVGVASGLDAAVSEAALQATQTGRTAAETAINIGGSVVLGGALGALVGRYLTPGAATGLSRKIEGQEAAFDAMDNALATAPRGFGTSAGAAARETGPLVLKDEALIKRLPGVNIQDPLIRSQLSGLDATRQTVRGLAETPLEYADNALGIATERGGAVETRIKMWNAPTAEKLRGMDTLYARYFHNAPEPTAWQTRLSPIQSEWARLRGGQKLTYKQFKEEVGRAAFSGQKHEVPEVAEAAMLYRQWDDALKQAAIDARLFPEDVAVKGDISHLFRMYDREKIIARRDVWTARLVDYLTVERDRAAAIADDLAKKVDTAGAKADTAAKKADDFARLSDAELRSLVDEITDNILGNAEGRIPYDIVAGPRGALKERTLNIKSEKISDFMELDIETVMRAQQRTMAPDVEISRKFGSVDMAEEIRKINDEANTKIAAATTEKQRKAIQRQRETDIRDIQGIRDRLRGTYALPSNPNSLVIRAGRVARNLNYARLLGGMTLSAIPDTAKIVFTHGLTSTFRDGFVPMVRNFKAFRLAAGEVKAAGTALDMILDSRTMAMADIMDDFGRHSKFERGLSAVSSKFGIVSLMAPWNASMKQFTGLITMTNILRSSKRLAEGTASADEIRRLAASGIDLDLALRINRQFSGGETIVSSGATTATPPPAAGLRRLYYGAADESFDLTKNKEMWVSIDPEYARKYRRGEGGENRLWYVDVPESRGKELGLFDEVNGFWRGTGRLPREFAQQAKRLQETPISTNKSTVFENGHGEIVDGVWLAQTGEWTDKGAAEAFRAAVVRDVDRIIVTPGQDKPLWMSTELGKMVGQFKSFSVSSMQKTMLAGLQQRDAATLNGTMLMLGLGALTYAVKEKAAGREVSDDPRVWAVNALDRSGLTGWLMEANNIAEKATRGRVGLSAISGEQVSRYASRNVYGAFLGPSADAVADIFQVSGSIFAGDTTKSDLHRARMLVPFQNLFYLRSLFDKVEEATGDTLGLPDTRRN